jgi:hypothetical protein
VNDPSTYWLTVTNITLGVVAVIAVVAVAIGVVQELAARHRRAVAERNLDRELVDLVASFDDAHALHVPGLGLTMADGGEDLRDKTEKR